METSMIYEERIYKIVPGRMPDILKRFTDHAVPLFERHGIKLVGFWQTAIGPSSNELTYILAYDSLEHRERAWGAFVSDPDWIRAKAESEKNGMLVADVANRILKPTAFSPLQ
jgi:hypothetical protein